MKIFTFLAPRPVQKITLTLSLILLFTSPLFAQRGWNHNKGDSTYFKHHPIHRPNDTILAHHINDSIFLHCRFDTAFVHRINEWNDTIYFRHRFDTAFAYWRDSLRRNRFDSLRARLHRFDTICAQHNWDTILSDTICMNHWFDTIIMHRHRGYVIFLHHVRFGFDKKSLESDVISTGSNNTTVTIPVTVNIYPNPIGESAVLQIANSSEALTFRLFDVTGKVVMSMENLGNGNVELNRNNLTAGIYIYQVLNNSSVVSTGKLAIQ
jgi:hypothetical protein